MTKHIVLIITIILLMAASFWVGTKSGRYLSSVERENLYPFNLREVWVNNQPTCDDYNLLSKEEKTFLIDTVKDSKNQIYVRIVSLPHEEQEGKLIYSILNSDQEQFIDELWLNCEKQDNHPIKPTL